MESSVKEQTADPAIEFLISKRGKFEIKNPFQLMKKTSVNVLCCCECGVKEPLLFQVGDALNVIVIERIFGRQ
jgi:hypothetical protein